MDHEQLERLFVDSTIAFVYLRINRNRIMLKKKTCVGEIENQEDQLTWYTAIAESPGTATNLHARPAAPAQHPARAAVASPLRREEGGVWRRMRVAAAAPRAGHRRDRLAPSAPGERDRRGER